MKRFLLATILLLALLSACDDGAVSDAPTRDASNSENQRVFDQAHWAKLVNGHPCEWWPQARLEEEYSATLNFVAERTKQETTCAWQNEAGETVLRASIHIWDSSEVLNHEKNGQFGEVASGSGLFDLIASTPTLSAILRKDRGRVYIFANSDEETVSILLSGNNRRQAALEEKQKMRESLTRLTKALL